MPRCASEGCRLSMALLGFRCRFCGNTFCAAHRLCETHMCDMRASEAFADYRRMERAPPTEKPDFVMGSR